MNPPILNDLTGSRVILPEDRVSSGASPLTTGHQPDCLVSPAMPARDREDEMVRFCQLARLAPAQRGCKQGGPAKRSTGLMSLVGSGAASLA
jgi:hypothetical protein